MSLDNVTIRADDERTDNPEDVFSTMTDRELLIYVAENIRAAVVLIDGAVSTIGPLLDSPKFKLLTKLL